MKILSWNVNGLRAVERKDELEKVIKKHNPDIFFIQETKSQPDQVKKIDEKYEDYEQFYHAAEKKGYSGVGAWLKKDLPEFHVSSGIDDHVEDDEGRIIEVEMGDWLLLGVYFPNGGKSDAAWKDKLRFYDDFLAYINKQRKAGKKIIWCGDVNCAHNEIDIARPKDNDGKVGFHPKERAWIDKCVKDGWVDVFRKRNPKEVIYSWWHLRSGARKRNVGWRIDYFFVDKAIVDQVKDVYYDNDQMGSDHCPVILEINM